MGVSGRVKVFIIVCCTAGQRSSSWTIWGPTSNMALFQVTRAQKTSLPSAPLRTCFQVPALLPSVWLSHEFFQTSLWSTSLHHKDGFAEDGHGVGEIFIVPTGASWTSALVLVLVILSYDYLLVTYSYPYSTLFTSIFICLHLFWSIYVPLSPPEALIYFRQFINVWMSSCTELQPQVPDSVSTSHVSKSYRNQGSPWVFAMWKWIKT